MNQQKLRLLVSSGDGPVECRIAVNHTLREIAKEADKAELSFEVTLAEGDHKHGPPSALVSVSGDNADNFVKTWIGTVQWVFKSPVRKHHKRQNWFIGIFDISSQNKDVIEVNHQDLKFDTFRAGGPGGQHQNTTDSAVRVTHIPTGISATSRDQRSQHRNKQVAIERLENAFLLKNSMEQACSKSTQNQLHKELERGNPIRVFKK